MVGGFFRFRHGLWLDRERRRQAVPKTDGTDKA
jgi:hypothetical protein